MEASELERCRICKATPEVVENCEVGENGWKYYCLIYCENHKAFEQVHSTMRDSAKEARREAEELWNKRMREGIDSPAGRRDWKVTCRMCAEGEIEPWFCEYYGWPERCTSPRGEHEEVTEKLLTVHSPDEALPVLRAELERRTVYLWQTKDGRELPVREMTDEHLRRTIAMLERVAQERTIVLENMVDAGGVP